MPLIVQKGAVAKQPYKFQEFPKYVYSATAPNGVLVKTKAELDALPGEWFPTPVTADEHTSHIPVAPAVPSPDAVAFEKQAAELEAAKAKIAELTKANADLVDALALANKPADKKASK
jgi:hypothetical protein